MVPDRLARLRVRVPVRAPTAPARLAALALLALAVALGLGACAGTGDGPVDADGPVVLGAVYNLTGAQEDLDGPSARGARLAVDQANAAGGVLGREIELVVTDGESLPTFVEGRTTTLLEERPNVAALFGLSDTDMVLAAAPVAAEAGRLFLSSGATSPQLPAEVPDWLYLACFGDNVQAAAGAEFAYGTLGARSVSILYDESATYTRLLRDYFSTRFRGLGGTLVSVASYASGADLGAPIDALDLEADMVYLSALPDDAVPAVRALRDAGFRGPIVGGDAFDDADTWAADPELGEVYFSTHAYLGPDSGDEAILAFREAYREISPDEEPNSFAALGYDSARLLLDAIARAGSDAPDAVLTALGETEDFRGLTGTISYPDDSRIPQKSVAIVAVRDGALSLAEEVRPVEVPAP